MGNWSIHYDSRIKRLLYYCGWRASDFEGWLNAAQIKHISGRRLGWRDQLLEWMATGKYQKNEPVQDVLADDDLGSSVCVRRRPINERGNPTSGWMPPIGS